MLQIYARKMDELKQHACAVELLNDILLRLGRTVPAAYERNAHGKPYLCPPNEDLHVNWSHSGDYVLCAVSDREIGVDLEYMKKEPGDAFVKKVIRGEECLFYENIPKEERKKFFYEYWTLKESFMKAIGTGFYTSLDAFRVIREGKHISIRQSVDERNWKCRLLTFSEEGYMAAVCAEEIPEKLEIQYI